MGFLQSPALLPSTLIILLLACNCVSYSCLSYKKSDVMQQQGPQYHDTRRPLTENPTSHDEMPEGLMWRNNLEKLDALRRAELIAREKDLFDKNLLLVFKLMDLNRKFLISLAISAKCRTDNSLR